MGTLDLERVDELTDDEIVEDEAATLRALPSA